MSDVSKISDRVRKLLALAADARGNPHEVEAAAREAQRLMQEHKLEEADVTAATEDGSDVVDLPAGSAGYMASWKFALATAVARAFFCEAVGLRVGRRRKVRIVGRREDAKAAVSVISFLTGEVERLTAEYARLPDEDFFIDEILEGAGKREQLGSYRAGLAAGVASTLRAQAKEFATRGVRETALVRSSSTELRGYMGKKFGSPQEEVFYVGGDARLSSFERGFIRGKQIDVKPRKEISNT